MKKGNSGPGTGPGRNPARGSNPAPRGPSRQKGVPMSRAVPSGGGPDSNKLVRPSIVGGSPQTRVGNPAGTARMGAHTGNHTTDDGDFKSKREPLYTGQKQAPAPLGNEVAKNVGRGGPGAGRINHGQCGSQGQWGPANPGAAPLTPTPGGGPGGFGFTGKGDR